MIEYIELLKKVRNSKNKRLDRTGTGTLSIFGYQMRFDLMSGFPLVTTKKIHFKSVVHELLWFLDGGTNIKYLRENGITIWDEWADEDGELGPIYGSQWRRWPTKDGGYVDQISELIKNIKNDPFSRRLILSAWNVGDIPDMKLAPCHVLAQFYVVENTLSCQLYQRSADIFLGVPFNIASYALLTHLIAQVTGLRVGELIHTIGDAHLYLNHLSQADEQSSREPRKLPELQLNERVESIFDFVYSDISLKNYNPLPLIPAPVAV